MSYFYEPSVEQEKNCFSIKDIEDITGIKAHTIRIWEKRYRILKPLRTGSNIRIYNEPELKKILNVAYLNRNGIKISNIAKLNEDEISHQVILLSSRNEKSDNSVETGKIFMSAIKFNETLLKKTLLPYIRHHGLERAYTGIFHPLLEKSRILWQTNSLSKAQGKFIRCIIKQLLTVQDNALKPAEKYKAIVAMINSSDNFYENNFLFYKYVLKKYGYDVIFTGGILPASELFEIYKIKPFDFLVANTASYNHNKKTISYLSNTGKSLGLKRIVLTDYPYQQEKDLPDNILISGNPEDFIRVIKKLK